MNADVLTFSHVQHVLTLGNPTWEPVLPDELSIHAHVDSTDGEELLSSYLLAARYWVENELRMALATRTFTLYMDQFPAWEIEIRMPPVTAITAINYLDTNGNAAVVPMSSYITDLYRSPGRITPAWGLFWPYTRIVMNAINVTGTCGYATADAVPEPAKQAIRYLAAMMYEKREPDQADYTVAQRILDPIRWEGYL